LKAKAWFLNGGMYKKHIVNDDGKYIGDRPWFVSFVRLVEPAAEMNAQSLKDIANRMEGKV